MTTRANARPGDSRDTDENPWINASGYTGRKKNTESTGGRRRRTTITDGRRRRTAAGSRWWKWGARGTHWRDGLQLQGGATSPSGDASSDKEQKQGCFSATVNSRPAQPTSTLSLHQHGIAGYGSPYGNAGVCRVFVCRYQRADTAFGGGESIDNSEHVQGSYGTS